MKGSGPGGGGVGWGGVGWWGGGGEGKTQSYSLLAGVPVSLLRRDGGDAT